VIIQRGSGTFTTCSFIGNKATTGVSTTIIKTFCFYMCVTIYNTKIVFRSSTIFKIIYCFANSLFFVVSASCNSFWMGLSFVAEISHCLFLYSSFFHHFQHLLLAISFLCMNVIFRVSLQIFLIHISSDLSDL
jgi:hypothetical protein